LVPDDKPGLVPNNPPGDLPGKVIRATADFAFELGEGKAGSELRRRAELFSKLTAAGSKCDAARQGALALLEQWIDGRTPRFQRIILDPQADRDSRRLSDLIRVKSRLSDPARLWWHLRAALDDIEEALGKARSDADREVFRRWQQEVWGLSTRSDHEHLFGSYVIAECQKVLDPERPDLAGHEMLKGRIAHDTRRLAEVIADAAQAHYLLAEEGVPGRKRAGRSAAKPSEASGEDWCHEPEEERPALYHQPDHLTGKLKHLDEAICPVFGPEADPRGLKRLGRAGTVWIVKLEAQLYHVYFRDEATFANATSKFLKLEEERRAAKQAGKEQKQA
jgi:hypothetical protein